MMCSAVFITGLEPDFAAENVANEVSYLKQSNRASFERTYGWAWTLRLMSELQTWDDPDAKQWRERIRILENAVARRALTSALHRETEGNPLFIVELARATLPGWQWMLPVAV